MGVRSSLSTIFCGTALISIGAVSMQSFLCRQGWRSLASSEDSQLPLLELWPQLQLLPVCMYVMLQTTNCFILPIKGASPDTCFLQEDEVSPRHEIKHQNRQCLELSTTSCCRRNADAQPPDSVSESHLLQFLQGLRDGSL